MVSGPTAFTIRVTEPPKALFEPTKPLVLPTTTSVWNLAVAERDARVLMRHHLGTGHDWTLKFREISSVLGRCDYGPKRLLFSKRWTIELGREEFYQTVLHEIGHALAGYGHGHDAIWATIVHNLGGIPNEKVDTERHDYEKDNIFKWTVTCGCGAVKFHRARKTEQTASKICRTCKGRLNWKQNF